jgi:hypothetical protein
MARTRFAFIRPVTVGSPLRTPQLSASHLINTGSFGSASPNLILISAEEDDVRFTWDGTAPTASVGIRIIKNQQPWTWNGPTGSMSFIGESGSGYINLGLLKT